MRLHRLVLALALATTGCAPALSTLQPAHVAKKGHVQAELGMDVSIPTGTIVSAIDAGRSISAVAQERELTEEEVNRIYDAATGLLLNPPSAVPHIGVAVTVADHFEVGLRYSTGALRGGVRYQFLTHEKHGVDATVGLGIAGYFLSFPVNDVLGVLEIDDFRRWQFDVPLVFGKKGNWYRLWGGPRLMFTTFGTEMTLNLPSSGSVELASFSGNGFYVGAQGGVALGYKYVFLGFELTMVELLSAASIDVVGQRVLDFNHNSFIVYPSIGLMGEF